MRVPGSVEELWDIVGVAYEAAILRALVVRNAHGHANISTTLFFTHRSPARVRSELSKEADQYALKKMPDQRVELWREVLAPSEGKAIVDAVIGGSETLTVRRSEIALQPLVNRQIDLRDWGPCLLEPQAHPLRIAAFACCQARPRVAEGAGLGARIIWIPRRTLDRPGLPS